MDVKICPNCGTENPFEANFCRGCRFKFTKQNTKSEGSLPKVIVVFSVTLIIGVCIYFIARSVPDSTEGKTEQVQYYISDSFAGNYSMKLISGGQTNHYTAIVKEYAANNYTIEVITEYGKSIYTFVSHGGGSIDSPELGKGKVTYKKSVKKLKIEFSGGNSRCELSRM